MPRLHLDARRVNGLLASVAFTLCLAAYFVLQKEARRALSAPACGLATLTGGALWLGAYLGLRRGAGGFRVAGRDLKVIGAVALLGFVLNWCVFAGLPLTSATNAAILARTDLLWVTILGYIVFGERPRRWDLPGIALMVAGAWIVVVGPWRGLTIHWRGDVLMVLHALALSVNAVIIRRWLALVDNAVIAFYNISGVVVLFVVYAGWSGAMGELVRLTTDSRLAALLVLLGGLLALLYVLYYVALKSLPLWLVRVVALSLPAFTAWLAAWWLHEPVTIYHVTGGLVLATGATLLLVMRLRDWSGTDQEMTGAAAGDAEPR